MPHGSQQWPNFAFVTATVSMPNSPHWSRELPKIITVSIAQIVRPNYRAEGWTNNFFSFFLRNPWSCQLHQHAYPPGKPKWNLFSLRFTPTVVELIFYGFPVQYSKWFRHLIFCIVAIYRFRIFFENLCFVELCNYIASIRHNEFLLLIWTQFLNDVDQAHGNCNITTGPRHWKVG